MTTFSGMGLTANEALSEDGLSDSDPRPEQHLPLSGLGPGVMLETSEGPQPVEWLRPGDLLLTRDHGYQPLLWTGRSAMSDTGVEPPLRIHAGAFGKHTPDHDLILSPGHHLLLRSPQVDLHFGCEEALAPALDIANEAETDFDIPSPDYAYCHLLMAEHEVVLAEGVWIETLFPDEATLSRMADRARAEIISKLGPALAKSQSARVMLHPGEAVVLQPRYAIAARRMAA
ncbi:Hint domain-containing protein [Celeribacter neptunius]|nr:Hint domain-containing protein [Celeribacter neptunius]